MSALAQITQPSLVRTLTIRLVTAALMLMVLQSGIFAVRDYFNETDFHDNYVRGEAQRLARAVAPAGRKLSASLPAQYTGLKSADYAFRMVDSHGRVIAEHNFVRLGPLTPWTDGTSQRQDFWVQKIAWEERMHVAGGLRIRRAEGDIWVELATFGDPALTYLRYIAQDVLDDILIPLLPLLLLTIFIAVTSVRSSLQPLVHAADRADEISILERGERLDVSGLPVEAAHFASATNRLLDRVADLVGAHRLFIARAAHELRTPLSIIMLELSHLKGVDTKRLEADLRTMSEIVDQLLGLSRLEALEKPVMRPIDLAALSADIISRMKGLADSKGQKLSLSAHEGACVTGDETALREALRNLVDNAIKHTPSGTEIRVEVDAGGTIVVEDSGPGLGSLSAEEMQKPFRKGTTTSSGAGLGLAIVRQAAELHDGRLDIGPSKLGGVRFVIRLPLQDDRSRP